MPRPTARSGPRAPPAPCVVRGGAGATRRTEWFVDHSNTGDAPLVSIVVPAYNVEQYVRATLDSTRHQGLPADALEVVVVDDGSTDGTAAILEEYAHKHENIRVIHQENSGSPGGPRNIGIDMTSGTFVFFLDADDELTRNALRDLVQVAEAEGSDVVLGKGEGINGRVVPGPVFRETILDADLIEDNVYRTLSPWKLFRRDLIERKQLRFHETLRIGEDQPFVASALLNARKISVLADRPYARLRARGDGTNVTATARSAQDYIELANAVIGVIIAESEPGRVRDGMLARPLKRTLRPIFTKRFLEMARSEQTIIVRAASELLLPYYTPDVANHLSGLDRTKMDLVVAGNVDTLRSVLAWEAGSRKRRLVSGDEGIRYDLPKHLVEALGPEHIYPPDPEATVKLLEFSVHHGRATLVMEARVPGLPTTAPHVSVRLKGRETDDCIEVPGDRSEATGASGDGKQSFACTIELSSVPEGVWDFYAVQQYPGTEVVGRLGAKRSSTVSDEPEPLYVGPRAYGTTYFTKGGGFLSLDIGFHVRAHRVPSAHIVGVMQEPNGDAAVVVSVSSVSEASVTVVISPPEGASGDGASEIGARRLSDGVYGTRITRHQLVKGSQVRARVVNDAGAVMAGPAESLVTPEGRAAMRVEASRGKEPVLWVSRWGVRSPRRALRKLLGRSASRLTHG